MSSILAATTPSSRVYTYFTTLVYTFDLIEGSIFGEFTEHDYFLYSPTCKHYASLASLRSCYSATSASELEQLQRKYHPEIFI
jgi:hypothetical protein